jgi:hypothetical protein
MATTLAAMLNIAITAKNLNRQLHLTLAEKERVLLELKKQTRWRILVGIYTTDDFVTAVENQVPTGCTITFVHLTPSELEHFKQKIQYPPVDHAGFILFYRME